MPEKDTQFYLKQKAVNLNTLLITCLIGAVAWQGQRIITKVDETAVSVVRLEDRVASLETSIKESITRSEFLGALAQRDQAEREDKQKIGDLEKEIESLRHHISTNFRGEIKP